MNTLHRTLNRLLKLEAAACGIPEAEFKLGYLLSFVSDHANPALLAEAEARIRHLEKKQESK